MQTLADIKQLILRDKPSSFFSKCYRETSHANNDDDLKKIIDGLKKDTEFASYEMYTRLNSKIGDNVYNMICAKRR